MNGVDKIGGVARENPRSHHPTSSLSILVNERRVS